MERGGGRGGEGMLGILLAQALIEYYRLEGKLPLTAVLIAANALIYLRPKFLDPILPTLNQVCFNPHLILEYKDLNRFLLSAFFHISEPHLVYNMLSLLWKGIQLESSMRSIEYASMVAALLGMSHGMTLLLARALLLFDYKEAYYNEYAVGFSGVLFAMKVILLYSNSDDYTFIQSMVPARYAAWVELILIQVLVPGVSFLSHLGGILAGLLYLYLRKALPSGGNLFLKIIRGFASLLGWPLRYANSSPVFGRGTIGRRETGNASGVWRCQACTFDNSIWLSSCEVCGTDRYDNGMPSFGSDTETISLEEDDREES